MLLPVLQAQAQPVQELPWQALRTPLPTRAGPAELGAPLVGPAPVQAAQPGQEVGLLAWARAPVGQV